MLAAIVELKRRLGLPSAETAGSNAMLWTLHKRATRAADASNHLGLA